MIEKIPAAIGALGEGTPAHLELTAMKVVEDLEAVRRNPLVLEHLRALSIATSPSGEPIDRLQYHFAVTAKLYRAEPTLADYRQWYIDIGVSEHLSDILQKRSQEMLSDRAYVAELEGIYDNVLNEVIKGHQI